MWGGNALGVTWSIPEREKYSERLFELQARLEVLMGGKAAEECFNLELVFGPENVTAGCTSDLRQVGWDTMADRDEERTEEDTEKEETDHTEPMSSVNREEEEPTFKSDSESSADGEVYESGDLNDASVTKYQAIHPDSMEDLFLPEALAQELKQCFQLFVQNSREAAAEALYDALTESLPTNSFSTPRPILSIRLITGISNLILNCGDPISLRRAAEVMAFQHLDREVNVSRLEVARDAMLAAIEIEVGVNYTARMHAGLQALLSYAAGAFLFVRKEYAIRIKTVLRSWSIANSTNEEQSQKEQEEEEQQQQEELEAVGVEVPPSPNKIQSGDDSPQLDTCEDMDFYKDNESMKVPSTFTAPGPGILSFFAISRTLQPTWRIPFACRRSVTYSP
ncbi:unnamed protein product [Effrenium voratum]|nr:unnamed protein product [Effrenium voratum]